MNTRRGENRPLKMQRCFDFQIPPGGVCEDGRVGTQLTLPFSGTHTKPPTELVSCTMKYGMAINEITKELLPKASP